MPVEGKGRRAVVGYTKAAITGAITMFSLYLLLGLLTKPATTATDIRTMDHVDWASLPFMLLWLIALAFILLFPITIATIGWEICGRTLSKQIARLIGFFSPPVIFVIFMLQVAKEPLGELLMEALSVATISLLTLLGLSGFVSANVYWRSAIEPFLPRPTSATISAADGNRDADTKEL